MRKSTKKKRWLRFRHRVVRNVAYAILAPYSHFKYGIHIKKFKEQEKRPYLILMNHQTAFDQFFLGMAFKGPIYYLASEDIFSNGWTSSAIRYLVAPIPIQKQTTDVKAILNCIRIAKEGGTIALAPEGNRTYSGKTEYMSPSIVPLARKLGLPVVLYRIEGGYGVHPRWSDVVRRGKMSGSVYRVISPEEYKEMTDEEFFEQIKEGLYVNEAVADGKFRHKRCAEYLERAIYVCPECGLARLESQGDLITCKSCQRQVQYLPTKELRGVGFDFPFPFVSQWYDYQSQFINRLDVLQYTEQPLYTESVSLTEVIPCQKKILIADDATLSLYGDRLTLEYNGEQREYPFRQTAAVTVLGKNKLNLYYNNQIFQIQGNKRFNALKYVHIYHRHKNITEGEKHGEFLGL